MRQDTAYADEHKYGYRGSEIIRTKHGEPIYAKTEGQQRLVEAIANNDIIFVNGPSGTGKTAISTWLGIAGIDRGIYKHLVLTRPVVTSGEEIGFLPGTMDEKVAPYMEPLYSAISLIKGRRDEKPVESKEQLPVDLSTKEKRKKRAEKKVEAVEEHKSFYDIVQVCPLAFIRGSTLASSFIVCDEFQNTTIAQMKTMLTRLGRNSKMVICGDSEQCDLPERAESGFTHAMNLLKGVRRIGFVELGVEDIVRHRLIRDIILRYERPGYTERPRTEDEIGREMIRRTHTPGWRPDPEGFDFSTDGLDDDDEPGESGGFDKENAEFAEEWQRRRKFA
jgi:phosphate starvation-inducible PhoH-like protein